MMCTVFDAISNRKIARGRVAKMELQSMTLHNSNGEMQVLLNVSKKFRLMTDDGSYVGEVVPWKMSKNYITVKLSEERNDKRRFLRLPCEFTGKLFSCGVLGDCKVTELAYGSCMVNCDEKLLTDEEATVRFMVNGNELVLNGVVKFEKENPNADEDDLWFPGYDYMVSFESAYNMSNALDELYSVLVKLMQSKRAQQLTSNGEAV